jgi:hypothetical protein
MFQDKHIPGLASIQAVGTAQTFAGFGSKYPSLRQLPEAAIAAISDCRDVLLNHHVQPNDSSSDSSSSSIHSFIQTLRDLVGD